MTIETPLVSGTSGPMQAHPGGRWYVVRTLAHKEAAAEHNLKNQGFRVFSPRFRKTIRHARKLHDVLAPLFPGYLFAGFDVERHAWRSINGTFGVQRLLTANERPLPVPLGVVEELIQRIDDKGAVAFDDGLKIGSQVKVLAGPFAHQLGVLQRLDSRHRVQILLQIMGSVVPVTIERKNLMKLTA